MKFASVLTAMTIFVAGNLAATIPASASDDGIDVNPCTISKVGLFRDGKAGNWSVRVDTYDGQQKTAATNSLEEASRLNQRISAMREDAACDLSRSSSPPEANALHASHADAAYFQYNTRVFQLQTTPSNPAWQDAVNTVTAMLPKTARLVTQPSNATLVLSADDVTLLNVGNYIQSINQVLSRKISVKVTLTENGQEVRFLKAVIQNGEPLPITLTRQIDYIKSVISSDQGDKDETATLNLGLSGILTLKQTDDGNLLVHYALAYSHLNSLTNPPVGVHAVQLPDVSAMSTDQEVIIPNGGKIEGQFSDGTPVTFTIAVAAAPSNTISD